MIESGFPTVDDSFDRLIKYLNYYIELKGQAGELYIAFDEINNIITFDIIDANYKVSIHDDISIPIIYRHNDMRKRLTDLFNSDPIFGNIVYAHTDKEKYAELFDVSGRRVFGSYESGFYLNGNRDVIRSIRKTIGQDLYRNGIVINDDFIRVHDDITIEISYNVDVDMDKPITISSHLNNISIGTGNFIIESFNDSG